jgi:hypothetical protein
MCHRVIFFPTRLKTTFCGTDGNNLGGLFRRYKVSYTPSHNGFYRVVCIHYHPQHEGNQNDKLRSALQVVESNGIHIGHSPYSLQVWSKAVLRH